MPPFATRTGDVKLTALRRLSARCAEIGGVNLSQGVCDLPTPDALRVAAKAAIDNDQSIYTNVAGTSDLRNAIAEKLARFNKFTVDPERELAVTVGSAGAFACVAMATLNPGDEVITFSPFYSYYVDALKLMDVSVRYVHTHPPDWRYDDGELAAAFGPRTRMILVNTPSNPSGKVFSQSELERIIALAKAHDAWIVTDEVYEYMTYDTEHVSAATLADAAGRTITLGGASKTFAVTGWRIGFVAAPADLIDRIKVINDLFYICAPAPLQHGVAAGFRMADDYFGALRTEYRIKRDMLAETLTSIGFEPYLPQGAFYMMANFGDGRYADAMTAAETILERVGVAAVPGAAFYADPAEGETQLRFCFAKRTEDLEEACRRLSKLTR